MAERVRGDPRGQRRQAACLEQLLGTGQTSAPQDRADIVAFLTTLTERDFSKDPRFADPFKRRGG